MNETMVTVHINGNEEFRLCGGTRIFDKESLMCGKDNIKDVLKALENAVSFCKVDLSRLNIDLDK